MVYIIITVIFCRKQYRKKHIYLTEHHIQKKNQFYGTITGHLNQRRMLDWMITSTFPVKYTKFFFYSACAYQRTLRWDC